MERQTLGKRLVLLLCTYAGVRLNYFTRSFLHKENIRSTTMCTELPLCFMVIMITKCVLKAAKDACETKNVEALKVFLEPVTEWRDISAYRPTAVTRPHIHIYL